MNFSFFCLDRLQRISNYLSSYKDVDRKYAAGRLLELESMAFSFRNSGFLTLADFNEFDFAAEALRRRFFLKEV